MDEAVDGEVISVGRTLIERRTGRDARVSADRNGLTHRVPGLFKLVQRGSIHRPIEWS